MSTSLHTNICGEQLFAKLYKEFAKDLHDYVYYKYGEHVNPEDKVQEAFIKLWNNCRDVPPEKAKSYLFTVINNLTLNDLKHQKVILRYQQKPQKDSTTITPQFIMEETEYMQKFQIALSKLPEGQREAFMLNRAEGKRHKEIAEILGISRKAVEKRIYSALDKLRKDLGDI